MPSALPFDPISSAGRALSPAVLAYARFRAAQLRGVGIRQAQTRVFQRLLRLSRGSRFALEHDLHPGLSIAEYQARVPLRDADAFCADWIAPHASLDGVLSCAPVRYLARTSGTSSGREKLLPVTAALLADQRRAAGLQGCFNLLRVPALASSPLPLFWLTDLSDLEPIGAYPAAMISRLVREALPPWLESRLFPRLRLLQSVAPAKRFEAVVTAALTCDFAFISGLTPWLLRLFEQVLARTGATSLREVWPSLRLITHAGVDFSLHAAALRRLTGDGVQFVESYAASEGFIGLQDLDSEDLIFLPEQGLFYEFVRADALDQPHPRRYLLHEVEPGLPYAICLSNAGGLWGYLLGDLVTFSRTLPWPRFRVSGRLRELLDCCGEKLLLSEVRTALHSCCERFGVVLRHFHIGPEPQARRLRLLLDCAVPPADPDAFMLAFDAQLRGLNRFYAKNRAQQVNQAAVLDLLVPGTLGNRLARLAGARLQAKVPAYSADPDAFARLLGELRQSGASPINA